MTVYGFLVYVLIHCGLQLYLGDFYKEYALEKGGKKKKDY